MFGKKGSFGRRGASDDSGKTQDAQSNDQPSGAGHRSGDFATSQRESIARLCAQMKNIWQVMREDYEYIHENPNYIALMDRLDIDDIADAMLYVENGQKCFSTFGQQTDNGSVAWDEHARLFYLTGDIVGQKQLFAAGELTDDLKVYQDHLCVKIAVSAGHLFEYFNMLLIHMDQQFMLRSMQGDETVQQQVQTVAQTANQQLWDGMTEIIDRNEVYKNVLGEMVRQKAHPLTPLAPFFMGHAADENMVRRNIYMTKEMGDQLTAKLAQMQAEGMKEAYRHKMREAG